MKRKIFFFGLLLVLAFSLIAASCGGPHGDREGRAYFGENVNLRADQKVEGDVVVSGGSFSMPASSKIDGDLVVFGGNAQVAGEVDGSVVVFGGNVNITESADIDGELSIIGGNAQVHEQARIDFIAPPVGGNISYTAASSAVAEAQDNVATPQSEQADRGQRDRGNDDDDDEKHSGERGHHRGHETWEEHGDHRGGHGDERHWEHRFDEDDERDFAGRFDGREHWHGHDGGGSFLGGIVGAIVDFFATVALIVVLMIVSWLVATFMPEQMRIVGDTVLEKPGTSFGVGLGSTFVVGLSCILFITICLAPVPILAGIALFVAGLFGWIVIAQIVGDRLLVAYGQPFPNFITATLLGIVALTLITSMPLIGWIWCIGGLFKLAGFLVWVAVGATGVGAIILTRFGTRPYANGTPFFDGSPFRGGGGSSPSSPPPPASTETDGIDFDAEIAKAKAEQATPAESAPSEPAPVEPKPVDVPTEPATSEPVETPAPANSADTPPTPTAPKEGDDKFKT